MSPLCGTLIIHRHPVRLLGSAPYRIIKEDEQKPERYGYCETTGPHKDELKLRGISTYGWKYITAPWGSTEKLYLIEDREKERSLVQDETEKVQQMKTKMMGILESLSSQNKADHMELDENDMNALRSLGYIQ